MAEVQPLHLMHRGTGPQVGHGHVAFGSPGREKRGAHLNRPSGTPRKRVVLPKRQVSPSVVPPRGPPLGSGPGHHSANLYESAIVQARSNQDFRARGKSRSAQTQVKELHQQHLIRDNQWKTRDIKEHPHKDGGTRLWQQHLQQPP